MPLEKIYIARHGFRLNWVTSTWQSETGLPRDPPLAAYGETQAKELAEYFQSLPEPDRPTAIFSSPYYRCLQTVQPTARALSIPIYAEHGISEWYSPVAPGTGLHPRPGPPSSLIPYFSEISPAWSSIYYPSQLGEDVDEVHDRSDAFLRLFIPALDQAFGGKHKVVLLASHAATVITLIRSLVGDRTLKIRVGCCSLTELVPVQKKEELGGKEEGGVLGQWELRKLTDGSHLSQGTSRDWGFEDIEIANGKVVEDPGVPGTENQPEGVKGPQMTHLSLL